MRQPEGQASITAIERHRHTQHSRAFNDYSSSLLPSTLPVSSRLHFLLAVVVTSLVFSGATTALRVDAAEWPDEYRAGPFVCHADFALAEHRNLLNALPRLQRDLVTQVGIVASQEPIHLFLFHRKSTYQAYLKQYFPDVPSRKALFIKGRGPGMVFAYRGEDFETDVRHECTHALLNAALPMVPLWLDEGLAEYFEVPAAQRANANPHLKYVRFNALLVQVPKLESLEQLSGLSEMNRTKYRHAWAWIHFMLHGPPEAREELSRYLADIRALTPPGKLSRRLRHRMPNLERRFAEHFKQWNSSGFPSL